MQSLQTNFIDVGSKTASRHVAYPRWLLLVWLNAGFGIFFNLDSASLEMWVGIVLGIMTYVVIYAELDRWLAKQGASRLRKRLYQAAIMRFLLQGVVMLDMLAGGFGLDVARGAFAEQSLGYGFTATVVHAAILSIVVGILMATVEVAVQALGVLLRKGRSGSSLKP